MHDDLTRARVAAYLRHLNSYDAATGARAPVSELGRAEIVDALREGSPEELRAVLDLFGEFASGLLHQLVVKLDVHPDMADLMLDDLLRLD